MHSKLLDYTPVSFHSNNSTPSSIHSQPSPPYTQPASTYAQPVPTFSLVSSGQSQPPPSYFQLATEYSQSLSQLPSTARSIADSPPNSSSTPLRRRSASRETSKPPILAPRAGQILTPSSFPPEVLAQLGYTAQLSQMAAAASGGKQVLLVPSTGNHRQIILVPTTTSLNHHVKSEPSLSPQNLSLHKDKR